jgi:hypothetical protein
MALLLMEFLGGMDVKTALTRLKEQLSPRVVSLAAHRPSGTRWTAVRDDDESDDHELLGNARDELGRIGLILRRAFSGELPVDGPLTALIDRSATARKKISRTGFKPDEAQTPGVQRAMAVAAPAVLELASQLNRLIERLERAKPDNGLADDRRRFLEVLRLIYVEP